MTLQGRNSRRSLLLLAASLPLAATRSRANQRRPLRFGTTPVFLDEQIGLLGQWQRWLESRLDRPVRFVQRGSYREIIDLLLSDELELAWLCGFPYVVYQDHLTLVSVPVHNGAPLYRSYLIVPASDSTTTRIQDLGGRVFAFSDPRSNSGYLVPRVELLRGGVRPERFFRRSFFTFGHRKVVEAVQAGLAQAGAVDGYVWDTLHMQQPRSTAGLRVAWQSPQYGFPPIVARSSLSSTEMETASSALRRMQNDAAGASLLQSLNLDAFGPADTRVFDGIRVLVRENLRAEREPA